MMRSDLVGIVDRFRRFAQSPGRRPKGGTASRDAYVLPVPTQAPGEPPPSPADRFVDAKIKPPRPLVWIGTTASGSHLWSSPVANGIGQRLWSDLREGATAAGVWPVLTGSSPIPASWRLDAARDPHGVVVPDAEPLLEAALAVAREAPEGFRTRLEPTEKAVVEADLSAGYLTLVCGVDGWQVPIAVGFDGVGGWSAAEHAAVLKQWAQRYKAELVALTADSVGVRIGRPPSSHEAAWATAQEIYAYCPDVVWNGVGSMWALASTIAVSPAWSLRWSSSG